MADPITIKALQDASLDAKSLEEVVNGDDAKQVTTRLGETYPSVKKAIKTLFENGGLPATPFKTKALMTASALVDGDYAQVTDDTVNNGLYVKTAGTWVKSGYDPVKIMRDDIAKLDSLRINKDSTYPLIFMDRGIAVTDEISKFEKHLLAIKVIDAHPDYYYRLSYMVHKPSDPTNTDDRNNGWQFSRVLKIDYGLGIGTETTLSNTRDAKAKFQIIPNTGIVRHTFEVSRGESFDIVFDTDGYDEDVVYDGYNKNGHAYQRFIDPLFYDVSSNEAVVETDSLEINRNKLFPFAQKKRGTYSKTSTLTEFEKSILSIRVNNALPDTYYRISYVQKNATTYGWQIRSIKKDVYESGNDLGVVLGDVHNTITPLSTGITSSRILLKNSSASIDITFDADMLPDTTAIYVSNRDTLDGFDHIIDPSNYYLSSYITTNTIPEKPVPVTDYHGFLPIDEYGAADFNNILFAKDIDASISTASITKVMTALVVLDSPLRLTDILTVTAADAISTLDVQVGDELSLLDALHVLLLPSSNIMSMTLGRYVGESMGGGISDFIELMNNKAKSLGMQNTKYVDTHGISSNVTTVRDTLILMHEASKSYVIKEVWGKATYTANVTGVNPRPLVVNTTFSSVLANSWCLGGKTGTTNSRFNLACYVELKNGLRGIVAVMRSETTAGRDKDLVDITNYVRNAYLYPETRKLTPLS